MNERIQNDHDRLRVSICPRPATPRMRLLSCRRGPVAIHASSIFVAPDYHHNRLEKASSVSAYTLAISRGFQRDNPVLQLESLMQPATRWWCPPESAETHLLQFAVRSVSRVS